MARPIPPELTAAQIEQLTSAAFQQLMAAIRAGESPQSAIGRIQAQWGSDYRALLGASLGELLGRVIGDAELKAWPIGELTLSKRLHTQAALMAATVRGVIADHAKGYHDARALTLKIFEGYNFRAQEPWAVEGALPKYLKRLDPSERNAIKTQLARAYASGLKTEPLKASYLAAINAIENGAGMAAIERKLKVAWYEKNRYFAQRIAVTELHRAYTDHQSRELMAEPQIQWVQVRLSIKHPKTDICNLHASVNRYGLGPGVYPKAQAPKPPYHPHCLCVISPRIDLTGQSGKEQKGAERQWLLSQPLSEQARILGSYDRADTLARDPKLNPVALFDRGKAIPTVRVGEMARAGALRSPLGAGDNGWMNATLENLSELYRNPNATPLKVASLPRDIKQMLGALTSDVLISHYTLTKQDKHPEIKFKDYAWLQSLLDKGERHQDRGNHVVIIEDRGEFYAAVLKVTANREEVYLQSFHRSRQSQVDKIRKRIPER